jgi:ornithine cyclodeaminase
VQRAYETHAAACSALPHSSFLRFPGRQRDRIIALPAYLGGDFNVSGIKWVSSFPGNLQKGLDRASAVLLLNSMTTGQPQAILESSIISAKRTAASAALAARALQSTDATAATWATLVGCGLINFEVARFLLAACPEINKLVLFDLDETRAHAFAAKARRTFPEIEILIRRRLRAALADCPLVSFATTAVEPHVHEHTTFAPGSIVLHVSLRDLAPELLLACDNLVDDAEHVCRERTSVHLVEQRVGHRDFIRGTLADVLQGRIPPRRDDQSVVVFSPFGLGVLDVAVGKLVYELALKENRGQLIESFLPAPWLAEEA